MGTSSRGPVSKRLEETMGHMTKAQIAERDTSAEGAVDVPVPDPDEAWHPIALRWYVSLSESGQSKFFEPSDWGTAMYVAEFMSRHLAGSALSGQMFASVMSATTELMSTEGSRRRLRLELQRADANKPASTLGVTAISEYKKRISG
jgi:hypothetical protein